MNSTIRLSVSDKMFRNFTGLISVSVSFICMPVFKFTMPALSSFNAISMPVSTFSVPVPTPERRTLCTPTAALLAETPHAEPVSPAWGVHISTLFPFSVYSHPRLLTLSRTTTPETSNTAAPKSQQPQLPYSPFIIWNKANFHRYFPPPIFIA